MKILIVHNALMDSTSVSGVMKHYANVANAWIADGHQTDFLIARAGFFQFQSLAPGARLINSDGLFDATRYLAKTWRYFPAYAWRCLSAHFVRLPERYDVIYASGQFIVEVHCALIIARRQRTRLAAKIQHVLHSQPKRHGLINALFLAAERRSARLLNRHADTVMCLSKVVADDYRALETSLGLKPRDTVQVGCGIDVQAMQAIPPAAKRFDVVFLGRMHEQKGVFDLPHVWQQILRQRPEARLLVIGEGPHRQRAEEMFRELGIAHTAEFTGGIDEQRKNALLAQCRLGLSLSYEEGWGLSVTEFLAMGLPVVAYALPVFEDVFPGQLELVKAGDREAAARAVTDLLGDEGRLRERGAAGREFARKYDYRQTAVEELQALEAATAQPRQPS